MKTITTFKHDMTKVEMSLSGLLLSLDFIKYIIVYAQASSHAFW